LIYPSADRLESKVGNKYALVIVAAKRARQLKEGAMPFVECVSENPLSIAMDEVGSEKITAIAPPEVQQRDPVLDLVAQSDAASAAVLLASLSGEDLELEEGETALAEEEEEEEPGFLLASVDEEEEAGQEAEAAETDETEEE
jgi:DNA-directed RNA polymerase subunit omega